MTTPKMAGMTPNSLTGGSFGLSPALLGQSPAAALSKMRSPAPSGNFSSPAMLSFGIPGMDQPLSAGNLGAADNKKPELWEILRILAARPGRASLTSIERLAKRMGLECYSETTPSGLTTLSLAAKIFLLDIHFSDGKIQGAALSFEKTPGPSSELADRAAAVFLKDLTAESETKKTGKSSLLAPSLAPFCDNLQRLAETDRLSSTNLNCFYAITGIYESLQKIFEYERENMGGEVVAMCEGNGRPGMHIRGKVGLSIDYWKEQRDASDIPDEEERLWRVIVEVQETTPEVTTLLGITPVRASNQWVSDEIKKPREDGLFGDMEELVTDWIEPPLEEPMDISADGSQTRPPSARFTARLDPPLTIPGFQEAPGSEAPERDESPPGLIPGIPSHATRTLHIPDEANPREVLHKYTLHPSLKQTKWGYATEIPFSHPKDLVSYFKILRQYACVTTLLESCFDPNNASSSTSTDGAETAPVSLDVLLEDEAVPAAATGPLPVDVQLSLDQDIGIGIVFPVADGVVNLMIQVEKNAMIRAVLMEDSTSKAAAGFQLNVRAVERALRASEDIGLVIEWIRQTYSN